MKILADWGITREWWRGERGEYWVLIQGLLIIGFPFLPVVRPEGMDAGTSPWLYIRWGLTLFWGLGAILILVRSLLDLGQNLTPLPYPKTEGQLVQAGIYRFVRHPIYSGVIALALAYASWQVSWVHILGAIALFLFLDAKAGKEENWLAEKFPDYASYRTAVKKLIPWVY